MLGHFKPIFHQKTCLRWVRNVRKKCTNNMKLTCPTQTQTLCTKYTYIPPALVGAHIGHYRVEFGLMLVAQWFALGPRGFFDTNMLVSQTGNAHVWGSTQRQAPRICVLMESKLYSFANSFKWTYPSQRAIPDRKYSIVQPKVSPIMLFLPLSIL